VPARADRRFWRNWHADKLGYWRSATASAIGPMARVPLGAHNPKSERKLKKGAS
jgi:hypothetical protein